MFNRQRAVALDITRVRTVVRDALFVCLPHQGRGQPVLPQLDGVEITIVSDRAIAQVHRRFLGIAGPTDVITFDHGEIIVSATTAARQGREAGEDLSREVARYIVHGFLHLNGHLDARPEEAAAMWQAQESVLCRVWPITEQLLE